MKTTKRILSLVLCFAMFVGLLPMITLNAEAAGTLIDAAIFCSDVHGNPDTVTSVFNGIKNADSTFNPSTASFVGDTQIAASSVTSAAQGVFPGVSCYYAFGNHDDEGSYGIEDVTGLVYGDSSTNYYIYAISENSMASANPDTTGFTSTVAGLDKTKPLFIISHLPLHSRRGDSNGAAVWYPVIEDAAKSMDIFFFWAHNHTGEGDADIAAYYVEKNGSETITLEDTTTVVTPNFTYANAGYIQPPNGGARTKAATAVRIYDDSVNLTVYTTTGVLTGEYAVNETVTRQFASTSGSGSTGTTTEEVYVLVDTMTVGKDYLIANGNSGSVTILGQSGGSKTTTTATVVTSGDYTYIETAEAGYIWNATAHTNSSYSSYPRLINAETYAMYANSSSLAFNNDLTATNGAIYTRYWTYTNGVLACVSTNSGSTTYYMNSSFALTSSSTTGVYIYEKQTITVSSDGTVSGGGSGDDNTGSGDSGNTGDSTETTVGDATVNTATDGSWQTVTFGTEGEKKTVYVLVSTPTAGKNYIIASGNSAGSVYALKENTTTGTSVTVNGATDSITAPYIENSDNAIVWTASSGLNFKSVNGGYYLNYSESQGSYRVSFSTSSGSDWTAGTNQLYRNGKNNDYYLRCNNGTWAMGSSNSTYNVYFYEEQTIDTSSSVTYSVTASDVEHFLDTDDSTAETAKISASVTEGIPAGTYSYTVESDESGIISGEIASDGTITFSGTTGTAQVKVSYTWTDGENTYTIWKVINVTATAPYYTIELHKKNDDGTLELIEAPVALKGIEANDTYSVWAVIKEYNEQYPEGNDLGDVEDNRLYWTVSDTSIATIDSATGVITFTGNKYGTFEVTVHYLDENGEILCQDTITISATESQYVVPGDGTNDFPEYPEQGAIRFDKTAVAQGNFSQTGIAKVELSMTGVPYGTNVKTDVVVMVDMTASMSDDDVTAAELAVQELIESLVYDEENEKYDSNIQLFIDVFYSASKDSEFETEEYLNCVTISSAEELAAAKAKINFTQSSSGGGTRYNMALADVYETLNRDGHAEKQFVVFVSDGVATAYSPLTNGTKGTTLTGENSTTDSLAKGWFDDEGEVTSSFQTEYYTYLFKTAGIPVYTVGANLTALSDPADVLNHMSSNYSADGKTATGETKYSFFCTTSGGITDEVLEIFHNIGAGIREAATNVVVEDKIDSHYTVNFSLPSGVTATEAGMDDFYIQVLGYELDENNDRKANPTVLEKFLFNSDGTITHTIGTTTCDSCTHVTKTDGVVTAIDGTYFDYTIDAKGDEFLTWTAEKLDRTELALEYFVYLDHSAGEAAADQVDPGTYPTNEYATITYTNFNGKECQQYFPIPTMTWMGAKVTYVFYLVNEDGQPVNRAGKVIPFAEAIFVTDPVTYDVTWNEEAGIEKLDAAYLAQDKVPDVYQLYDNQAYYEILVYQTEGVDQETQAVNYNHFIIEGSSAVGNKETTKVYNTKAGNRFDDYGAYSATTGSYTSTKSGTSYTATVTKDIDYANTTVAFAVVWKPELNPDTVVIDYGLDVIIDVTTNDALASGVVGVSTTAPDVAINNGTYKNSVMGTSVDLLIGDLIIGTAKVENLTSVRFSLNESSGMQFSEPVEFYYESACNYYTYDGENKTLNTTHMYSSVTVIPATTIYYEDEFVTLTTHTRQADGSYKQTNGWTANSSDATATQAQDRPGKSQISAALDADNNYGFDAAYETMSEYSMGKAAMMTVSDGIEGQATFDFYGTGFDVISMTNTTTGTIVVNVYAYGEDGTLATETTESYVVDTYYGYQRVTNDDGTTSWVLADSNNSLYQVPVMKISGLNYGKYQAKILVLYDEFFDNVGNGSYDFYLDAIRIYDPTGNQNSTANNAYKEDGEGWPEYFEVRDKIISANTFESVDTEPVEGIVFIDGYGNTNVVSNYTSYGPNNELYLAPDQAIAFELNATASAGEIAKVQMALKTVGGSASVKVYAVGGTTALDADIATATDMYYDITSLNGKTVVIVNDGDAGILSITNVKVTYTEAQPEPTEPAPAMFMLRRSSVDEALATLNTEEEVPETTVPEETVPETTVPEETVPETTVPEETEPETTVPEETEPETTVPEETVPEETEPSVEEQIQEVVEEVTKIIKKIFGWLFG